MTTGVDRKVGESYGCVSPQVWIIMNVELKLRNAYHLRNGS